MQLGERLDAATVKRAAEERQNTKQYQGPTKHGVWHTLYMERIC